MKILVIGMDNTGKTTLCSKLSEIYNLSWIKSLGPGKSKEEMLSFMKKNLLKNENMVFERFPLFEEMVYGEVLRGKSNFSFNDEIVNLLKSKKVKIIYCRPHKNTILNFGTREQMDGVISESEKLIEKWDCIYKKLNKLGFECYRYNWEKDNYDKFNI